MSSIPIGQLTFKLSLAIFFLVPMRISGLLKYIFKVVFSFFLWKILLSPVELSVGPKLIGELILGAT